MANKKTAEKTIKEPRNYASVGGILMVFVLVSIAYMAYVVILGVNNNISRLMTVPALLWASIKVIITFWKASINK